MDFSATSDPKYFQRLGRSRLRSHCLAQDSAVYLRGGVNGEDAVQRIYAERTDEVLCQALGFEKALRFKVGKTFDKGPFLILEKGDESRPRWRRLYASPPESNWELTSLRCSGTDANRLDIDDVLASDFMVKVFHAYLQRANGEERIDLSKPVIRKKLFGGEVHHPLERSWLKNWEIHEVRSQTGFAEGGVLAKLGLAGDTTIGIVAYHAKARKLIVAFRGTQEGKDWLGSNLSFHGTDEHTLTGLKESVHSGYWSIAANARKSVLSTLQEILTRPGVDPRETQLILTGHSLGGATAVLMAAILSQEYVAQEQVAQEQVAQEQVAQEQVAQEQAAKDQVAKGQVEWLPPQIDLRTFGAPEVGGEEFQDWIGTHTKIKGKQLVRSSDVTPYFLGMAGYFPTFRQSILLPHYDFRSFNYNGAHDARYIKRGLTRV